MRKTIILFNQIMANGKWVKGVSYGDNALFLYEIPTKQILVRFQEKVKQNSLMKFLDVDLGNSILTIASNRLLDKRFRGLLNFRLLFFVYYLNFILFVMTTYCITDNVFS